MRSKQHIDHTYAKANTNANIVLVNSQRLSTDVSERVGARIGDYSPSEQGLVI